MQIQQNHHDAQRSPARSTRASAGYDDPAATDDARGSLPADRFAAKVRLGRKVMFGLGIALVLLVGVVVARTATHLAAEPPVQAARTVAVPQGAVERLAGSLRIPTISHEDPARFDADAFQALHAYLRAAFPRVHSQLRRETVATHSLLYTWQGTDPSLDPMLVMGHLDVVPVEPGTEDKWHEGPFSGRIADGFIWGRGSIDNKSTVVGALEAVEMLLGEGFRPRRTILVIRSVSQEVIVAPYLVVVVTDSRYFVGLTDNVLRFLPLRLAPADLARMHGTDERVAIEDYERAIRIYRELFLNAA